MFHVKAVGTRVFMIHILLKFCSESVSLLPSKTAKCRMGAATFLGNVDETKNNVLYEDHVSSAFVSVTSYQKMNVLSNFHEIGHRST
jgi:hypothetical protein